LVLCFVFVEKKSRTDATWVWVGFRREDAEKSSELKTLALVTDENDDHLRDGAVDVKESIHGFGDASVPFLPFPSRDEQLELTLLSSLPCSRKSDIENERLPPDLIDVSSSPPSLVRLSKLTSISFSLRPTISPPPAQQANLLLLLRLPPPVLLLLLECRGLVSLFVSFSPSSRLQLTSSLSFRSWTRSTSLPRNHRHLSIDSTKVPRDDDAENHRSSRWIVGRFN